MILSAQPTKVFLGECAPCVRPVRATDETATGRYAAVACPQCGGTVRAERLYATTNGDPCDGQCMSARRNACSCGCGGLNHGKLYESRGEATETAVAEYRATVTKRTTDAAARDEAKQRAARRQFDAWAQDHRDILDFLGDGSEFDWHAPGRSEFLYDMGRTVARGQALTERQADAVRRWMDGRRQAEQRRADEKAAACPVPTGDAVQITGTVTWVDMQDNPYGPGARYRMLITGDGWKVWSTVPGSLRDAVDTFTDLKGKRVELTAGIEAKPDDPTQGNAKRPRKAKIVDVPALVLEF